MRILLHVLFLTLLMLSAQAQAVSYNGTKPAAIIDVRTPEEFLAGHIEGAVNIPYEKIGQAIQSIKGIGKESTVLLYCRSGRRSGIAKSSLEQLGYKHILDGGGMESLKNVLKN